MKFARWAFTLVALAVTHYAAFLIGDYQGFRDTVSANRSYGRFLGPPRAEWLEGRDMKLLEDFVYVDPNEKAWLAPQGSVVNGASIPQALWSFIGGPFEGKYRNASIVHDVACEKMVGTHEEVHRMFFDACMAGGVDEDTAEMLYWAVARYGPKWAFETRTAVATTSDASGETLRTYTIKVPLPTASPTKEELVWARDYFRENDPKLEKIASITAPEEVPSGLQKRRVIVGAPSTAESQPDPPAEAPPSIESLPALGPLRESAAVED